MQTVHGVPLPIYRGFQLLADAGDVLLPVTATASKGRAYNHSGPLTIMATANTTTKALHIFLSNFAPDDGGPTGGHGQQHQPQPEALEAPGEPEICYKMRPNPCTEESCYLADTDFSGGDLLPESQKFTTPNASACCDACLHFKVDKFCQAWVHAGASHADPGRCYLKTGAALPHRHHSKEMTAGFPAGIAPPLSRNPWYNATRTVKITIGSGGGAAAAVGGVARLRMINSTCANPKSMWLGTISPGR
jgi:hypothetical protein